MGVGIEKRDLFRISTFYGAGGENRTLVACLEGRHISHYTTPASCLKVSIAENIGHEKSLHLYR